MWHFTIYMYILYILKKTYNIYKTENSQSMTCTDRRYFSLRASQSQNYFHNSPETWFTFFTVSFFLHQWYKTSDGQKCWNVNRGLGTKLYWWSVYSYSPCTWLLDKRVPVHFWMFLMKLENYLSYLILTQVVHSKRRHIHKAIQRSITKYNDIFKVKHIACVVGCFLHRLWHARGRTTDRQNNIIQHGATDRYFFQKWCESVTLFCQKNNWQHLLLVVQCVLSSK